LTARSLILGLLAAVFLAGVGYINDSVLALTRIVGNHFPISVFGGLILAVILVNPVLGRVRASWRLRPGELAVIATMMLVVCFIPGSGLMRTFVTSLALPAHYNDMQPGWRKVDVMTYAPAAMLPAGGARDAEVLGPLFGGAGDETTRIGLADVPWGQWITPLSVWIPLLMLLAAAGLCISLVVHPQWSRRERLRYPIAQFARSLIEPGSNPGGKSIVSNRLFWCGLIVVLAIRVINGLHAWEELDLQIPLRMNLLVVTSKWPQLWRVPGVLWLVRPIVFPTVVAFSFFLATDVAFSLGIAQVLFVAVMGVLMSYGVDTSRSYLTGGGFSGQYFGAYVGIALLVGYTGRRYYWGVLKQAATFRRQAGAEGFAVWACRGALLAAAGMVAILIWLGLDWPFAIIMVLLMLMMFTVMARINVESGLIFLQPWWQPLAIFIGLFGVGAMGPHAIMIVGLLCMVMTIDPRECLMPFVVNGLRMCSDTKVKLSRVGGGAAIALVLGMAVAVPAVLWASYNYGMPTRDSWAVKWVPKMPFDATAKAIDELDSAGKLGESIHLTTWQRIRQISPSRRFLWWAGAGLALVLAFSVLRLRYTWWPIHPILFLVWGTYPIAMFHASIFIGFVIKAIVTKLGGGGAYNRVKPLMVGVIAGDLLGGLGFMVAGAIRYGITGTLSNPYMIFPG